MVAAFASAWLEILGWLAPPYSVSGRAEWVGERVGMEALRSSVAARRRRAIEAKIAEVATTAPRVAAIVS